MSQVMLYECGPEPGAGVRSALKRESYLLATCGDGGILIEDILTRRPDALVYVLRPGSPQDLAILQLVRRFVPALPIIVVAHETSLHQQRVVQALRPIYYAVAPVEATEIQAAVDSALARRGPVTGTHLGQS